MLNVEQFFTELIRNSKNGKAESICSVCSSNRFVLEASMKEALRTNRALLIEATANQINQFGGYTGMRPVDFKNYVFSLAEKNKFNTSMLILGGDHLGPLVWSGEDEDSAMEKAEELIKEFAEAGFLKIHIDCSMRLASDDKNKPLPVETVAKRAARLCEVAEKYSEMKPVYVVGSEVPIPGGATEAEESLKVTSPEDMAAQRAAFEKAFCERKLSDAWKRVVAIVVQPGVEFGDDQVFTYNSEKAKALTERAKEFQGMVLEGHSTDYQPAKCLSAMRNDGIGILKVGPALTFAAREALFALEKIEREMYQNEPEGGYSNFADTLENVMMEAPENWNRHYHGDEFSLFLARKFSLSDRSRYYMENEKVKSATERLIKNINGKPVPLGLLHQYMPRQAESVVAGLVEAKAEALIYEAVNLCIRSYYED